MDDNTKKKIGAKLTKYRPEYAEAVREYFRDFTPERVQKVAGRRYRRRRGAKHIERRITRPTLAGFAREMHVHPRTVCVWRAAHPEFDAACTDCLMSVFAEEGKK